MFLTSDVDTGVVLRERLSESVPFYTFSDCFPFGVFPLVCVRLMTCVCTDHDFCVVFRLFHRDVEVRHVHVWMGASQITQRYCPRRKKKSRHGLRRSGPVAAWWIYRFR
jgi:hypothetical protein